MKTVLQFLLRYAPGLLFLAITVGTIAGLSSSALVALITNTLTVAEPAWYSTVEVFGALVVVVLVFNYLSRVVLLRLTYRSAFDLRLNYCRHVANLPMKRFEEIGVSQVLQTLTQDVPSLGQALLSVPDLCVSASIVIGCSIYLAYLSPQLLIVFLVCMALAVLLTRLPEARARVHLEQGREQSVELMGLFDVLTDGFKELKLHVGRREAYLTGPLLKTARLFHDKILQGQHIYVLTKSQGQVIYFLFVGLILFGTGSLLPSIDLKVLTAFTITVLYMQGPINKLLDKLPTLGQARVAAKHIKKQGLSLVELGTRVQDDAEPQQLLTAGPWGATVENRRIEMIEVSHTYYREREEDRFMLGPVSLTIEPGELIFIVGGNGSGKTTLAKVLIGLYPPESGEIRCDGKPVAESDLEAYRQHFSVVFSDFHIFTSLLGLDQGNGDLDDRARHYLSLLHLDHKVKVEDGVLSTTELSQGQRKRLALLTAYLEDRPIYLFDEWAADQDPAFKKVFYLELVPDLKRRGKTVIAISHDDRFYDCADRLIKLEDGQVVEVGAGLGSQSLVTAAVEAHAG